jgi:hypothetical protein
LIVAETPAREFGKRRPAPLEPVPAVKRSRHVALLLMGTFAIGGGAYALMPAENCEPKAPGMEAPSLPDAGAVQLHPAPTADRADGGRAAVSSAPIPRATLQTQAPHPNPAA